MTEKITLPESELIQDQRKILEKKYEENWKSYRQVVCLRYDNSNWNWHNEFAITTDIWVTNIWEDDRWVEWWAMHDEIIEHFPELKKYIKWHLVSSDWPMYYIENTMYLAKEGDLEWARKTAIYPEASLTELQNKQILMERLPDLMKEFKKDMEELWFKY